MSLDRPRALKEAGKQSAVSSRSKHLYFFIICLLNGEVPGTSKHICKQNRAVIRIFDCVSPMSSHF